MSRRWQQGSRRRWQSSSGVLGLERQSSSESREKEVMAEEREVWQSSGGPCASLKVSLASGRWRQRSRRWWQRIGALDLVGGRVAQAGGVAEQWQGLGHNCKRVVQAGGGSKGAGGGGRAAMGHGPRIRPVA